MNKYKLIVDQYIGPLYEKVLSDLNLVGKYDSQSIGYITYLECESDQILADLLKTLKEKDYYFDCDENQIFIYKEIDGERQSCTLNILSKDNDQPKKSYSVLKSFRIINIFDHLDSKPAKKTKPTINVEKSRTTKPIGNTMKKFKLVCGQHDYNEIYSEVLKDLGLKARHSYNYNYNRNSYSSTIELANLEYLKGILAQLKTKGYAVKCDSYSERITVSKNKQSCYLYLSSKDASKSRAKYNDIEGDDLKNLVKSINNYDTKALTSVDEKVNKIILEDLKARNESKVEAATKLELPKDNQLSFGAMIKADAMDASYRVAATQLSKASKTAILALLQKAGHSSQHLQTLADLLDTELGGAAVSALMGLALTYLPIQDQRAVRLAKEFRVASMATAGNVVVGSAIEHLLPVVTEALSTLPKEDNKADPIKESPKTEIHVPIQEMVVEQVSKSLN